MNNASEASSGSSLPSRPLSDAPLFLTNKYVEKMLASVLQGASDTSILLRCSVQSVVAVRCREAALAIIAAFNCGQAELVKFPAFLTACEKCQL